MPGLDLPLLAALFTALIDSGSRYPLPVQPPQKIYIPVGEQACTIAGAVEPFPWNVRVSRETMRG